MTEADDDRVERVYRRKQMRKNTKRNALPLIALGSLLAAAVPAVRADVTLEANGETGTVQVAPNEQIDLSVDATQCPAGDSWRDTWSDDDGLGIANTGQEEFDNSTCVRSPTRSVTAPDNPGSSYVATFESESCEDGAFWWLTFDCPTTDGGGTEYETFDQDSVTIEITNPAFIGNGSGLAGDYCDRGNNDYDEPCTSGADVTRIDPTIEFTVGDADWPPDGIGDDYYSVRWTGEIQAQYSEDYTFHALHDDGVRVWVDGTQVIDRYVNQDDTWTDADDTVALERGERYDIVIEYYENTGDQDMTLAWSSASTANRTTVPESQLYPSAADDEPEGLLLDLRMDEDTWDGTTDEVTDASGNGNDGTAQNGAQTDDADPAIDGDPGTCGYGVFDGSDQYVDVPGLSDSLNGTATLTFWIRTTQSGSAAAWQSPGVTGVEQEGGQDDIFWGWLDENGRIGLSVGDDYDDEQLSTSAINDGTWRHVALTRDADSGDTQVYVDGALERTGTSGTGTIGEAFDSIGRIEDTGGTPEYFEGELDEVRVYDSVLGDSQVAGIAAATHPCTADDAPQCPADYAVYTDNGLNVGNGATVNDNAVSGSGNAVDPDTGDRTDADLDLPDFDPASFPTFSGSQEQIPPPTASLPADDYERIQLGNNQTTTLDTSNGEDFRINELDLGNDATVNLDPGTYFIDSLTMGNDATITVTGGTAEIYLGSTLTANDRAAINAGGDADDLILRMYDGVQAQLGNDATLTGTVYAPGPATQIQTNDGVSLNGGIFTAGSVQLGNDSELTYGAASEAVGRDLAQCDVSAVDRYVVSAPGAGLTCVASVVAVEARDADGDPIDPNDGTALSLSTDTAKGTWSRVRTGSGTLDDATTDDGDATYTFPGDESMVELSFDYPGIDTDPESVVLTADDGMASGISDPLSISLAGFRFVDDDDGTGESVLSEQIAAKPSDEGFGASNIGLQAIRASDEDPTTCEGVFGDGETVAVEVGAECRDPDTCAGNAVEVNDTDIATSDDNATADAPAAHTAVDLTFGSGSTAPLTLNYEDAGAMRLYARHEIVLDDTDATPTSEFLEGTSNEFVVRPFGFHVSADGNPGATGPGGDVYEMAGEDFTVEVSAVGWQAGDDTGVDGVPDGYDNDDPTDNADLSDNPVLRNFGNESSGESVTLSANLWQPDAGTDAALGGDAGIDAAAFADDADVGFGGAGTEVNYPEVGIVELAAELDDNDYLGTGFDISGRTDPVGRFRPERLEVSANDPAFRDGTGGWGSPFTYMGQPFTFASGSQPEITVTAVNAAGATTQNYGGEGTSEDFWRLGTPGRAYGDATDDTEADFSADDGPGTASWEDSAGDDTRADYDGRATLTIRDDEFTFARIDAEDRQVPFNAAVDLELARAGLTDADGVCYDPGGGCSAFTVDGIDGTELRYGRLVVENVSGSELAPLEMPIYVEYWTDEDGDPGWMVNGADLSTELEFAADIDLTNEEGDLGSIATVGGNQEIDLADAPNGGSTDLASGTVTPVQLSDGEAILRFAAPGEERTGWAAAVPRLASNHPWLQYDWATDGDPEDRDLDDDPRARATFGIYEGPPSRILLREVPAN